jgi:hypothetical protein
MFVGSSLLYIYRRSIKYKFYCIWFDPTGLKRTICRTRDDHANLYTTAVVTP